MLHEECQRDKLLRIMVWLAIAALLGGFWLGAGYGIYTLWLSAVTLW